MADNNPSKMEEGGGGRDDDSIGEYSDFKDEYVLTEIEKRFLLAVERGDCATVRRMIHSNKENPDFNLNCVDPLNRSALISAIENENFDLMTLLLEEGIEVKDALLHAISEEYVEAVEELLHWEETHHVEGTPYSWEAMDRSKSTFTPDISPLILAAHRNNYEILKVLLDRGASIPMPHDVKCGCDECVTSQESDSLRHSQSRINAYRALSASSLIALSSRDPVLTAFELAWELKRLQSMESEFRAEYHEMRLEVQEFSTSLLDHARTSNELEIMLNFDHEATTEVWMPGERQTLERLKLAIKYKQKNFVAHPNVQQLLAAIWYEGLPGFRRKTMIQQLKDVAKLGCMFPVYSMNYIVQPDSEMGKFMKKPFVKFISHSASYAFFLMLLGAASQRVEVLALEFIGLPWMLEILEDWKKHERGSIPGPIELGIIMYIMSLIFGELKTLYEEGIFEYVSDLWNIIDFISNMFYCTWILCRAASFIIVQRDYHFRGLNPWYPREHWHPFDPMLLSEGAFAAGMIFSFLKLVHIFSINPHLGPLQVSLGRMIIDIIKFFFIYTLVLFAFGCGLNQLLWYYADLEKHKCYHFHPDVPDFDEEEKACTIWRRFANLFETSQSLFWASFGLVDLVSFDLAGIKSFTRFWALLMFGSYSVINIIVLLNMLIAMMSNSYQIIAEKADVEWKFARSQLWISYFEDGDTLPPPFNLCPSAKMFRNLLGKGEQKRTKSIIRKSLEKAVLMHDKVMRLLVRRYITAEQRKRDEFSITEDDIMEVRQDISSLRFELIEIFNQNNMKVPRVDNKNNAATKKGRVMERRILKDFQIGIVEGLQSENPETKDVFSTIAKLIQKKQSQRGKRGEEKGSKKDWNKSIKKGPSDPIGSRKASEMRRSQRSLRRHSESAHNINTEKLIDLNPKLEGVTPTTRVAYVKFMTKKLERQDKMKLIREVSDADTKDNPNLIKSALTVSMKKRQEAEGSSSSGGDTGKTEPGKDNIATEKGPSPKPAPEKPSAPGAVDSKDKDKKDADASKKADSEKQDPKSVATAKTAAPHPPAAKSGDSKPGESKPTDSKPDQTKPGEAKQGDPKAASPAPAAGDKKPSDSLKSKAPQPPSKEDSKSTASAGSVGETKAAGGDSKAASGDTKPAGGETKAAGGDAKAAGGDAKASGGDAKAAGGDAKPASGDAKAAGGDAAKDGKSDDKKPKPPPAAPQTKPGQSNVGIGSDKGKSTVTGRVISGWL